MTASTKVTAPTVHLNGTSKEDLIEAYCNARQALRQAAQAIAQTCPNGRDYYVQPLGNLDRALEQHESRLQRLNEIDDELVALLNAVADQGRTR